MNRLFSMRNTYIHLHVNIDKQPSLAIKHNTKNLLLLNRDIIIITSDMCGSYRSSKLNSGSTGGADWILDLDTRL